MNKQKIKIGKSLVFKGMFVISLLVIIVSISYSWFVTSDKSHMSGIVVNVAENTNLLLSQGKEWHKNLHFDVPEGFTFPPVTGNGTQMYRAVFTEEVQTEDGYEYYKPVFSGLCQVDTESSVVSCEFSMKVEQNHDLYLSPKSYIRPVAGGTADLVEDCYMFAALRVAFMQKINGEYQTKMIWIPDVTTQLVQNPDGTYSVNPNGAVESTKFVDEQGNEYTINGSDEPQPSGWYQRPEDGILYVWGASPDDVAFGELIGNEKSDFQIVIWLDGNDRECREVAIEEKFEVNVTFEAVKKLEPTE